MKDKVVTMPELGLIAGTRVALGVGLGLLIADRLDTEQRRAAGWALFIVGALTTVPLVVEVMSRNGTRNELDLSPPLTEKGEREFVPGA
jgi:hypothetical protein